MAVASAVGWRGAMTAGAAGGLILTLAWLATAPTAPVPPIRTTPRRAYRDPARWRLAVTFGLQGMCFWGVNAWLPSLLQERGWSAGSAGWLLAATNPVTLVGTRVFRVVADRELSRAGADRARRRLTFDLVALAALPGAAIWSLGGGNPLRLAVPARHHVEAADDPDHAGAISGVMLGAGYCLAAVGPSCSRRSGQSPGGFSSAVWTLPAVRAGTRCLVGDHLGAQPY